MRLCNSNVIINLDEVKLIQKTDLPEEENKKITYSIFFIFDVRNSKPIVWKYVNKEDRDQDFDEIIRQINGNNMVIDLRTKNTVEYSG